MVATVRCEEIANEKLSHLASDEVFKMTFIVMFFRMQKFTGSYSLNQIYGRIGWSWKRACNLVCCKVSVKDWDPSWKLTCQSKHA